MPITPYSQRDSRWSSVQLGSGNRTIGSDGCLLTALCSKLNYHGLTVTPKDVVARLKEKGGIQPSGDTAWPDITKAFPGVIFRWRWSTTLEERGNVAFRKLTETAYWDILTLLALGQPTIIRTETYPGFGHWVLAVDGDGVDDLIIMDPWDGQMRRFSEKYGKVKENLFAYSVLIGSPNGMADHISEDIRKDVIQGAGAALHAVARGDSREQVIDQFI